MARSGKMESKAKSKINKAWEKPLVERYIIETVVMKKMGRVNNSSGRTETTPRIKASEREEVVPILELNLRTREREIKSLVPGAFLK